ncbi:YtxH domain-containing protein [Parapusillimonas sp. SGNA-6]|uniref:YtxH domain-containing protein n=1 Tax=Parapedobacter sp. SGR-10 TaxID=2710879 RepID=UPI0013D5816D|nr:YtxH domain-containing protein [Parapedobacter sp. SGR-10]NGF55488.1 YtxH domain-containing protein [Parapedobacter sp. SGR-10]NGM89900.1 YtxH domain-containing protein [Parapusillimonas sp. SGNA-6]
MKDSGKIVTAMLAGLAAGAVLGILFAPDKGSETRDKLNESLADLGDALKERAEEQFDQLNEFKEKILSAVKSKLSKAEDIIEEEIEEHA